MRVRLALLAVLVARGAMACIDGVTPDCSNPAVCAPIEADAASTIDPFASDGSSDADARSSDGGTSDAKVTSPDAADAADADGG